MNSELKPKDESVYSECLELGFTPLQARITANRISRSDNIPLQPFLSPVLSDIPNPSLMVDMDKAAQRLAQAIMFNELIAVSTDFDTDGCSSCAIIRTALLSHFKVPPQNLIVHVSDRMKHGYGLTKGAVDEIMSAAWDRPPTVVITADHGSADKEGIAYYLERMESQNALGDVIVTDHHEIPDEGHPENAFAVCNPKRDDCGYPESSVCGGVVAYFLIAKTSEILIEKGWIKLSRHHVLLSFGGLATIGDMMDLRTNTNRAIVRYSLEKMNQAAIPAWHVVKGLVDPMESVDEDTLGFGVSPPINSASRMGYDGMNAVNFLTAVTPEVAKEKFDVIKSSNAERQEVEASLLEEALFKAEEQVKQGRRSLIVFLEEGHAGVNGIVCSRIKEKFHRPSSVLSRVGDVIVGSCRSMPGFDFRRGMSKVFTKHKDIALRYGGHSQAAGLTIRGDKAEAFKELFEKENAELITDEVISGKRYYDGVLFEDVFVNDQSISELAMLSPYGQKFERPVFLLRGSVSELKVIGANKNTAKFKLTHSSGYSVNCIWFKAITVTEPELPFVEGDSVELIGSIGYNYFMGKRTIQCKVDGLA